jgi:hypothetical protein
MNRDSQGASPLWVSGSVCNTIDLQRDSMYDVSEGVRARNCLFRSMLHWGVSVGPDPETQETQISFRISVCAGNRVSRRGCLTGVHQSDV